MNRCVKSEDFSPFFLLSVILRDESVFGVRILDTPSQKTHMFTQIDPAT